jgi:hypothetical protein
MGQYLSHVTGLNGRPIALSTPKRDPKVLAHEMAGALVIEVRVSQRVPGNFPVGERRQ